MWKSNKLKNTWKSALLARCYHKLSKRGKEGEEVLQ